LKKSQGVQGFLRYVNFFNAHGSQILVEYVHDHIGVHRITIDRLLMETGGCGLRFGVPKVKGHSPDNEEDDRNAEVEFIGIGITLPLPFDVILGDLSGFEKKCPQRRIQAGVVGKDPGEEFCEKVFKSKAFGTVQLAAVMTVDLTGIQRLATVKAAAAPVFSKLPLVFHCGLLTKPNIC